jgi:hypothetical protein
MRQGKRRASDVVKPDQFASVLRSGSASAAETGTIQKLLSSRSAGIVSAIDREFFNELLTNRLARELRSGLIPAGYWCF